MYYRLIISMLHDSDITEDVLQEGWLEIYRSLEHLKEPGKFRSWAYTIFRRKAIDVIKIRVRDRKITQPGGYLRWGQPGWMSGEPERSSNPENIDLHQSIINSIGKLPWKLRETAVLYFLEGCSHKEISDILGITEGAVEQRIHRAKIPLQSMLKEYIS